MNESELAVLNDYESTLSVPKLRPEKLFVLCPVGLVGAGKTTVVKPLSERLGLVRISGDEIRKMLKERGLGYENVSRIVFSLAEKYIKNGYSIAIDSDCASEHTQKMISKAASEYKAMPVWIHINPPESFIVDKLKNFKHTWLFKNADEAIKNYLDRKPLHENLAMPFAYAFDTSKLDLEKQMKEAVEIIKQKTA